MRVIQIAYNTQNFVGAGCYESVDSGLTDFGRDVLAEMNRLGILADSSHVGRKTSADVIEASTKPVVYSHVCPAAIQANPRNKTDEELRFIEERGGLIGVNLLPSGCAEEREEVASSAHSRATERPCHRCHVASHESRSSRT